MGYNSTIRIVATNYIFITAFLLALPFSSSAQVIIKEKMELQKDTLTSKQGEVSIQGHDGPGILYPQFGGSAILQLFPFYEEELKHEWVVYEKSHGKLSGIIDWNDTTKVEISGFRQWQKLDFYLKRVDENNERHILNSKIISSTDTSYITFESIVEDNPSSPGIHFPGANIIISKPDSTDAAIPPEDFFTYWWSPQNIFKPTKAIVIPDSGLIIAKINEVRDDANYELHTDIPAHKTITSNLNSNEDDTVWVGYFTPSEKVRLFIKSSHNIVQGMPLYPVRTSSDYGVFRSFAFEGWTDMRFDDIELELLLKPHPKEPVFIDVSFQPESIPAGDTASVNAIVRSRDWEPVSLEKNHTFDVELDGSEQYATILHPNKQDTADSFEDIPLGFKIIANNSNLKDDRYTQLNISTTADGPYVKNKKIRGDEYIKLTPPKFKPCEPTTPEKNVLDQRKDDHPGCKSNSKALGNTRIVPESIKMDFGYCFSTLRNQWEGQLLSFNQQINYGICFNSIESTDLIEIDGAHDSDINESSYCHIKNRISKLLISLKNNKRKYTGQDINVWSPQAILEHEKVHVEQIKNEVYEKLVLKKDGLLDKLKTSKYSLAENQAANTDEAKQKLSDKTDGLKQVYLRSFEDYIQKNRDRLELNAEKPEEKVYGKLLEAIQKRANVEQWKPCTE